MMYNLFKKKRDKKEKELAQKKPNLRFHNRLSVRRASIEKPLFCLVRDPSSESVHKPRGKNGRRFLPVDDYS